MRALRAFLDDLPAGHPDFRFPLSDVPNPGAWTLLGACGPGERRGSELIDHVAAFFPDDAPDAALVERCRSCPVQAECLAFALRWPVRGVWGGLTEAERKTLRNRLTKERRARERLLRQGAA